MPQPEAHRHWPYEDLFSYRTPAGPRPVRTPADWEVRRARAERALLSLLGPLPVRRAPLEPVTLAEERFGAVVRRTVEYTAEPGERVRAYVAFPAKARGRLPVVLSLHGTHERGKDARWHLPGHPEMEHVRLLPGRGLAVVAPDGPTTGERVGPHQPLWDTRPFYARHPGRSILGQYAFEASRAVDLVQTLEFADPGSIGCVGHSLGGHWAIVAMALDGRIGVGASSAGFVPFRTDTNAQPHNRPSRWARDEGFCYMPALARYYREDLPPPCDWHELLALLAPRPFLNVSAWRDECFQDAAGIPECCARVSEVYRFLGAADRFDWLMTDTGHAHFEAGRIYDWLVRWLAPPPAP